MSAPEKETGRPIVLEPAPLPVDWADQEEEWRHHLTAALGEMVEMEGYSSRFHRPPEVSAVYHEVSVRSTPPLAPIELHLTPYGVVAVLAPSPEQESSRKTWETAIRKAIDRLGGEYRSFDWVAYVADDSRTALAESATVGNLELGPAGTSYLEVEHSQPPMSSSFQLDWSYPVKVNGSASGVRWNTASAQAGEDLYRLCAVLSIAVGSYWTVKQFAHPVHLGEPALGDRAGYLAQTTLAESNNLDRRPTAVPEGLSDAWDRAGEAWIAGPLSAHYRALALERGDPTTALTLFVAAVEGVGAGYVRLERCECGAAQIGAGKRFRRALEMVLREEDVRHHVELYKLRSSAAHGDLIIGQPLTTDTRTRAGWFYSSPEHELTGKVWDIRQASQCVLEAALMGRLPGQ